MIKIIPISKQSFRTFPLDDESRIIEITEEEYNGLMNRTKSFSVDMKKVVNFYETEEDKKQRQNSEQYAMRSKRRILLSAFDIYKQNVAYGIDKETNEDHINIISWYNDILDLKYESFTNVPESIKKYI